MKNLLHIVFVLLTVTIAHGQAEYQSTGSGGAYALSIPANIDALTPGLSFTFKANHVSANPSTLNVNGLGAVTIMKGVSTNLDVNDILAGQVVTVVYDGTNFQMTSAPGSIGASGSDSVIADADSDTEINVEAAADQDVIHFNLGDNAGYPAAEYFTMIGPRLDVINSGWSLFIGKDAGVNDDLSSNANTFLGYESGNQTTTGNQNVAVGYQSLRNNQTGFLNVAVGSEALKSNMAGNQNVAIGQQSLLNNNANDNIGIGRQTLYTNTTGTPNIAIGSNSMYANTTGADNIAIGLNSLQSNTTGFNNVAFGTDALSSSDASHNVAIGAEAIAYGTAGNGNVAIGTGALSFSNSNNNVAIGYQSMRNNAAGFSNTAVGYATLPNSTGNYNAVLGQSAGNALGGGNRNVFIGFASGGSLTNGSGNIFIGNQSGGTVSSASNKLYIENSNSDTPLIYGDFSSDELAFNAKVGIGTLNPNNKLSIVTDASDGLEMQTYGAGNTNMMSFLHFGGTIGSPSTTTSGTSIGTSLYSGYGTSTDVAAARIRVVAESVFTDASSPGAILLETTATGSNFPTEKLRITSEGNIGVGSNAPSVKLEVANGDVAISNDDHRLMRLDDGSDLLPVAYGVINDGTIESAASTSNFTVVKLGNGQYQVNYIGSRPFGGLGEFQVTCTPYYQGETLVATYQYLGGTSFEIFLTNLSDILTDGVVSFELRVK
ncbi:beta strand repeat-containing protein [Parvicella tangerina]|nr:hypothetical protein [Parvicella tangerina]